MLDVRRTQHIILGFLWYSRANFSASVSSREEVMKICEMITIKGKYFDLLSNSLNSFFKGNVWRSVWRICLWIFGLKGLIFLPNDNISTLLTIVNL